MVASSTIQTLRLYYNYNIVVKSHAVIFVGSGLDGRNGEEKLTYRDAEKRGKRLHTMYSKVLKIDEVEICVDFTKAQIIEKFDILQASAEKFDRESEDN